MAFGINKKNIAILLSPRMLYAHYKKNKLLKQYKEKNLRVEMFVAIENATIGKHVFLGSEVQFKNATIGDYSYINAKTHVNHTRIGKFCSIGPEVQFGLGKHPTNLISTHPTFYATNKPFDTFSDKNYFKEFQEIELGNDVWIGSKSIIMGGVTIGNGAIVAAGSIVTKDVQPYEVVGGVPAKHIKYRLDENTIIALEKIKWWDKDEKWLQENYELFLDNKKFIKYFEKNT